MLQLYYSVRAHPYLALISLVIVRLFLVKNRRGLRDVPGPFLASFSNLWKLTAVLKQNMPQQNIAVHEKFGPLVRIGPNHVSISDPVALKAVYGFTTVFRKVTSMA